MQEKGLVVIETFRKVFQNINIDQISVALNRSSDDNNQPEHGSNNEAK